MGFPEVASSNIFSPSGLELEVSFGAGPLVLCGARSFDCECRNLFYFYFWVVLVDR